MDKSKKQGFHTVDTNVEELEEKIKKHRKKIFRRIFLILMFILAASGVALGYLYFKEYTSYRVISETERTDNAGTQYAEFGDGLILYNNDGATYMNASGNTIWNQAFEMQNPAIDICENYVTIYDISGEDIYIMNRSGNQGEIKTSRMIRTVSVANQGTVAVLTRMQYACYIDLYAKDGTSLASGTLHSSESGFPMAISLSNDANKLAVSMADMEGGQLNSTIVFYNFGSVGQNEIDNIVGSYQYEDSVIPQIEFVTNDQMIAFGDNKVIVFEGTQKPEVTQTLDLENEVESVFFKENAFGLIFSGIDAEETKTMQVYDLSADLKMEKSFSMDYTSAFFMKNGQICVKSDTECSIFSKKGIDKFHYVFDEDLNYIFSDSIGWTYTLIFGDTIQKVRFK